MASHTPTAEPRLHLGQADDGRVLSAEEFADAEYEAPWQYERVEGRLVATPPDGIENQRSYARSPDSLRSTLFPFTQLFRSRAINGSRWRRRGDKRWPVTPRPPSPGYALGKQTMGASCRPRNSLMPNTKRRGNTNASRGD